MKVLLLVIASLLSGCATRGYVDERISDVSSASYDRTMRSHSSMNDEIDRVEGRLDQLRKSVLSSSEIRNERHKAYWSAKLDSQQYSLDALRNDILKDGE